MNLWKLAQIVFAGASEASKTVAMVGAVSVTAGVAGQALVRYAPDVVGIWQGDSVVEQEAPINVAELYPRIEQAPKLVRPNFPPAPLLSAQPLTESTFANSIESEAGSSDGSPSSASEAKNSLENLSAIGLPTAPIGGIINRSLAQKASTSANPPAKAEAPATKKEEEEFNSPPKASVGANTTTATNTSVASAIAVIPSIKLSSSAAVVVEGTSVTFTVTLSSASTRTVTVNYAASSGTATAGADFPVTIGTLSIPAGSFTGNFSILAIDDSVDE